MPNRKYPLTFEQCLEMGGHCYEDTSYVIDTYSPIYHRTCKHCGHVQEGQRQPTIAWREDSYQPYVRRETDAQQ